jgi:hypothetical protein
MPDAGTALRACVAAAVREGGPLMQVLVDVVKGVLEAQALLAREQRRRDALERARHVFAEHATALVRDYPAALRERFDGPGPGEVRVPWTLSSSLDFAELSLRDEAEVTAQVELARAQHTALHATEAVLAELDALVSAAQGLPRVQPDLNPLRPENYIRALQQVVGATGVAPDVRAIWMEPLRDALATQLVPAYQEAVSRLRADGVVAPNPGIAETPAAASDPASAAPSAASHRAQPARAQPKPRWPAASEVVHRMMDDIAQDDRLLRPVQRSLLELRPALQRLAWHDPHFFTDDQHPARRLLDALTLRALAFDSEDADNFTGFARCMDRAVASVLAGDTRSADTFAAALVELEACWAAQERSRRGREEEAHAVALELTRREELSHRVSTGIRALARAEHLPADIVEFAAGPWADVAARAQDDQPGEDDPGGYLAAVTELFWLARPELAARSPERLEPAAAHVLRILREGLDHIGHDPGMTAAVLDRVAELHLTAAAQAAVLHESSEEVPGVESSAAEGGADAADAGAAGVELAIGAWMELTTNHRTVHTQLTWASPHHTLFLFTAPDGSTQSMTRRVRDKLMSEGALKVLPGPPVARRGRPSGPAAGQPRTTPR